MLWLWHRLAATAPVRPLAWEPPYAIGVALEETKRQKKKKKKTQKKKTPNLKFAKKKKRNKKTKKILNTNKNMLDIITKFKLSKI